ncbi:acyltransferase family protein [Photobacterium piscicola]|uniref:acyltransferase family protein n=1 Tax=Photobacterium piscicola TaxID=1378299 RepID=UPI002E1984E2|nr:acyltransferase family protein [Photobacterium piscicola]
MKFRTDINGLRAIAVIAVVLFHFNPSWVPGGFAGVDVFFVISGFLMTGLIFRGLENNNFSIINFYVARANRIIPALSVVCLALLVFGWFYLTPLDYRVLGEHVTSSMTFVSNIIYRRESGYFDVASHSKWLLHTWSLSVEWQFYMIYPVVLVLLKKSISLTNIKRLLVVGTVVGFIFSACATYHWSNAAYFLFPTRAWEMMMGGLAFLYPLQNIKEISKKYLEWVGIALILASYAFISKDNLWPGYLALIPVLGAYLVIIANRSGSVITDNIVMQKVGLWSYSIYLWHWPVVVFGYYFEMRYWEWIGIPVSVLLGFCSYKFVESIKFPALASISFKPIATFKPLWMVVSIGLIGYFILVDNGAISLKYDKNNQVFIKNIIEANGDWAYPSEPSERFNGAPVRIIKSHNKDLINDNPNLFVGDSLIEQYYPKIKELVESGKMPTTIFFTKGGCLPIKGFARPNWECPNLYKVSDYIKNKKFNNIFMGGLYTSYFSDTTNYYVGDKKLSNVKDRNYIIDNKLKKLVDEFKSVSKNVYFVLPTPYGNEFSSNKIMRDFIKNKIKPTYRVDFYRKKFKYFYKIVDSLDIKTIDPISFLCKKGSCSVVNDKWSPYYKDGEHMRPKYVIDNVNYFDDFG